MPIAPKANLAWLVQVEESYGTRFVRAHIVIVQPDGELHSPQTGWGQDASEYADFRVSAYLGDVEYGRGTHNGSQGGKVWGLSHEFKPHEVRDAARAAGMVKVFNRVTRGLAKAETESGYVKDGDFLTYLTRIGAALGIRTYYVRNHKRVASNSGEVYKRGDASTVQYWLSDTADLAESRPADIAVGI